MNRRKKLLAGLDLKHLVGLEIGLLDRPIVTKAEGEIVYVDHTDTHSLRQKYARDSNVDVAKIVDVDAVWGAQTLQECLGPDRKVDYVIASHVIEHVPNLIGWLEELRSVLKSGGVVKLAVPDRRFTFDYLRRETRLCDILYAHLVRARVPTPFAILDFILSSRPIDHVKAWEGTIETPKFPTNESFQNALHLARDAMEARTYHDVHCWVFTPWSFAELFEQASELGLIKFCCEQFYKTDPYQIEFIASLRECEDRPKVTDNWRRMKEALLDDAPGEVGEGEGRLAEQLRSARSRIAALESSTSWRQTAPLRTTAQALRTMARASWAR